VEWIKLGHIWVQGNPYMKTVMSSGAMNLGNFLIT